MPNQTEELKLIVSLTDNASAGLSRLREEMSKLGGGTEAAAKLREELDKLKKQLGEGGGGAHEASMARLQRTLEGLARGSITPLTEAVGKLGGGFAVFARGIGVASAGLAVIGTAAYAANRAAANLADTMTRWQQLGTQTGIHPAHLRVMSEQMRQSGISAEQAGTVLSNLSANMARFGRDRRNFTEEILKGVRPEFREGLRRQLDTLDPLTNNPAEFANRVKEISETIYSNVTKELGEPRGAAARDTFLSRFGLEGLRNFQGRFKAATKEQIALQDQLIKATKEYNTISGRIATNWERIKDAYGKLAVDKFKPLLDTLVRWTDIAAKYLEWKAGLGDKDKPPPGTPEHEYQRRRRNYEQRRRERLGEPAPGSGAPAPGTPMRAFGAELSDATEEQTGETEKLTAEMKKLSDFYERIFQPGTVGGASGGPILTPQGLLSGGSSGSGGVTSSGGNTGGVTASGTVQDQAGIKVDPDTVAGLQALATRRDVGGMRRLMAARGYRVDAAFCGDLARVLTGGSGFGAPKGYPVASIWRKWGEHSDPAGINAPGRPFGSMVMSRTHVPIGSTGGHVATIVPGTYDPKSGTVEVVDTHGRWRRSVRGFEIRYAGDAAVAARQNGQPATATTERAQLDRTQAPQVKSRVKVEVNSDKGDRVTSNFSGSMFPSVETIKNNPLREQAQQ